MIKLRSIEWNLMICADIYSKEPFVRQAAVDLAYRFLPEYRLGMEAILGLHKVGNTLVIDPVIPPGLGWF